MVRKRSAMKQRSQLLTVAISLSKVTSARNTNNLNPQLRRRNLRALNVLIVLFQVFAGNVLLLDSDSTAYGDAGVRDSGGA